MTALILHLMWMGDIESPRSSLSELSRLPFLLLLLQVEVVEVVHLLPLVVYVLFDYGSCVLSACHCSIRGFHPQIPLCQDHLVPPDCLVSLGPLVVA